MVALQAFEKLTTMNDPEKGGSKYLNQKFTNARDSLVGEPPSSGAEAGAKQEDGK